MGLQPQTESMQNAKKDRYIDKGDLLLLWNTKAPTTSDGSQSARSTSGSSTRHEDESVELPWNPLGLEAEELAPEDQGKSDGELLWNPLGLKGLKQEKLLESRLLSKPPGLEEVEGAEHPSFWSRSTTAGTVENYEPDPVADEVLASEIATVLNMMQRGQCSPPWLGNQMPQRRQRRTRQGRTPELRGSPFWPAPGAYLPFAPGQAHFCPWCGSARMIFHKFCPFCGVSYPDVDVQLEPEPSLEKQFIQYAFGTQM